MFLALPLTQQCPLVFWVMLTLTGGTLTADVRADALMERAAFVKVQDAAESLVTLQKRDTRA